MSALCLDLRASQEATHILGEANLSRQATRCTGEIIPDSEEERTRAVVSEVIEISSDDESLDQHNKNFLKTNQDSLNERTVTRFRPTLTTPLGEKYNVTKIKTTTRKLHRARRVIESSSSGESDIEIQPLRDQSGIVPPDALPEMFTPVRVALADDYELNASDNGSAILVLNEPKRARKPIRLPAKSAELPSTIPANHLQRLADDVIAPPTVSPHSTPASTPQRREQTPRTKVKEGPKPKATPRSGKKAQAEAARAGLERYAEELFNELNRTVFKNGLPKDTKLHWNKRLLTTAGRAKWHRSREGIEKTEIELAEKILDCKERIRNTLSHEMCHLASWIIDENPNEGHGHLFKAWAAKVMLKRPEIEISTRHDYDISYPFNWKCLKCAKVYGRHSKSIDVDRCLCGACKEGRLEPLFTTRASKVPSTPKISRLAPTKPQDSPRSLASKSTEPDSGHIIYTIHDSDSEDNPDILALTAAIAAVALP